MNKTKWEKVGVVAVDSGQLMVCDPCYISEWKGNDYGDTRGKEKEFSYTGCCHATLSEKGHGQLKFKMGHDGAGVAFSSGYGDGCYDVYARKNAEGRIVEVRIKMG